MPSALMSEYIALKLRESLISNCSSPSFWPESFPVYLLSWSPIPVEAPAETFVAAIFTIPFLNSALSREETVIPANGKKIL